jgi:hypothetical protein
MVKFSIKLRMNEMKNHIQLQTFHYFMTTNNCESHKKICDEISLIIKHGVTNLIKF